MHKPPFGIHVFHKIFKSDFTIGRKGLYRTIVLILTFLSYAALHACRKVLPVVKPRLQGQCDEESNICVNGFEPFDSFNGPFYFFVLDISWSTSYALGMIAMGYAAERLGRKLFLVLSLFGTAGCVISFGLGYILDIHSFYYYFYLQIINGIFQSAGWPTLVPIVSSWIPKKSMGTIMGIWGNHNAVGNIVGQTIAAMFVDEDWGFGFLFTGFICGMIGILVIFFLISKPPRIYASGTNSEKIGLLVNDSPNSQSSVESGEIKDISSDRPVGFFKALFLPGVLEFSFSLFFCKIVIYTFLFWLPYYISQVEIKNYVVTPSTAGFLSALFDVGGIIGNIISGIIMDLCNSGGILVFCLQILSAVSIYFFYLYGSSSITLCIAMLLMTGFFVNSPNSLITGTISASLSNHPKLHGNKQGSSVIIAIVDGIGCMGAVAAPILVKQLLSLGWNYIMYSLIASCVLSGILLIRQMIWEFRA